MKTKIWEAAIWLQRGLSVRRKCWEQNVFIREDHYGVIKLTIKGSDTGYNPTTEDLLADDWTLFK